MLKAFIARLYLALTGWRFEGSVPGPRFVLIAAPHTSNWDLVYLLALSWGAGVRVSWMGKHSLFAPPFGGLMRWLGGVPVRRDRRNDLVSQMCDLFQRSTTMVLTVPAEGTRERVDHWKSGFYHIARAARVPIVPGFLDYARRRGGFGPPLYTTGEVEQDMDVLREFYADKVARYPNKFGTVRLREEEKPAEITEPRVERPGA